MESFQTYELVWDIKYTIQNAKDLILALSAMVVTLLKFNITYIMFQ